ncbi:MAG: hypothetical protein WDW38_000420 [Sanguina aurantia]
MLSGTYPTEWRLGEVLQAQVNSLTSFDTEMPFEYYTMPFCKPPGGVKRSANSANPGTILQGLRIENSPYTFTTKVKQVGQKVCQDPGYYGPLTAEDVTLLQHKIDNHYRVNMVLDNLPVTVYDLLDEDQEFVRPGFELGFKRDGKYYINNHLVFNILVYLTHGEFTVAKMKYERASAEDLVGVRRRLLHSGSATLKTLRSLKAEGGAEVAAAEEVAAAPDDVTAPADESEKDAAASTGTEAFYMIVGFEVSPCSIQRDAGKEVEDIVCGVDNDAHITAQEVTEGSKIVYTYDVYWQDSKIKWASRWDAYLRMPGGKVHWFSIGNSVLVVLVMATIVATIMIRTVHRDLAKYEALVSDGGGVDVKDEAGWKLVSGDVFRSPAASKMLAVQVGSGVQIIATFATTLGLATLGFLSPAARGALLTTGIIFYVCLSLLSGLVSVYMWGIMERTFKGWPSVCLRLSMYYPGITMAIFTVLNLLIKHTGTTGAVPVAMYFSIVAVWFLVSIPLTFTGGFVAVKLSLFDFPVKTNQIPRHVPPPPLAASPTLLFLAAGILPFGTIFIELYFAMTSLWLGYFYYLFGFVFLIGLLTIIINAEIAVLCTYVQLCAEDYTWWWSSFYRGGSVALYMTLYALGFLMSTMSMLDGFIPVVIYLSYMSIIITGFYLAMGTIGFAASAWFVHTIFKAVKQE